MVDMTPVKSSNVSSVGYDAVTGELHVQFANGVRYKATDVPLDAQLAFMAADSKGSHFHKHLRSAFDFVRVQPEEASS